MRAYFLVFTVYLASAFLSGCATPYGILYTGIHTARAYRASTPNEVVTTKSDPTVHAIACAQSVLGLVAWGEGGYSEAVQAAMAKHSDDNKVIYDVKSDVELTSVLGFVYNRACTSVTGKVGRVAAR